MITNTQYFQPYCHQTINLTKPKSQLSFGVIKPEHLFIYMSGFDKDMDWGRSMSKVTENAAKKVKANAEFNEVLDYIANEYKNYRKKNIPNDNIYFPSEAIPYFGVKRVPEEDNGKKWCTRIDALTRYAPYAERFENFLERKNQQPTPKWKIKRILSKVSEYIAPERSYTAKENGISLSRLYMHKHNPVEIWHADVNSVQPALNHVENIYKNIKANKSSLNIEETNKQIAEIHWFMSQAVPYYRGTAGITDMFTKSIYESLDIQVSPWKAGVAPDLEAFTMDLEEYKDKYSTLFEKPPVRIHKNSIIKGN